MREKVILLLPLTYNDGSAVALETLEQVYDALFALCDGYNTR